MVATMEDLGNPFMEESGELLDMGTGAFMSDTVISDVRDAKKTGEKQYEEFQKKRILSQELPFSAPIKRNSLKLVRSREPGDVSSKPTRKKEKTMSIMQLLLAENSGRNIKPALCHENSTSPPSFTHNGQMHAGCKSDIIPCLVQRVPGLDQQIPFRTTAHIIDGPVIVHSLSPQKKANVSTFEDFAKLIFIPYILEILEHTKRLDLVFDDYLRDSPSLKQAARDRRGTGERCRVNLTAKIPKNWQSFLRSDENKKKLFTLLADVVDVTPVTEV